MMTFLFGVLVGILLMLAVVAVLFLRWRKGFGLVGYASTTEQAADMIMTMLKANRPLRNEIVTRLRL